MFNISSFLEKISKNISKNNIDKKTICDILFETTNINLNPNDIDLKNNIIYINTSPAKKNKIFIFKNTILDKLSILSEKKLEIR